MATVLVTLDSHIDFILKKVFSETHRDYQGESQIQLLSRFMNFLRRDSIMQVYFDNFIAQEELAQESEQMNGLNVIQRIDNSSYEFCSAKLVVFQERLPTDAGLRLVDNTSMVQARLRQ